MPAIKFVSSIDLTLNQLISALFENLTADPGTGLVEGRVIYRTDLDQVKIYNGTAWHILLLDTITLDAIALAAADVNLNSHKITNLAAPTAGGDAVTKTYADALFTGLDWKAAVRAASTANVNIASAPSTLDGVTLAANNRVLLKNQTTGSENGIYVFSAAASALTRATDADSSAEVTSGLTVAVTEGTTNADSAWLLITGDPITLGTTSLSFSQLPTPGSIVGGAGLTLTGTTLDVNVDNSSIEINADILRVKALGIVNSMIAAGTIDLTTKVTGNLPVANGGTGSNTAAGARTNLAATTKFAADVTGDGVATAFTVTHSLGTKDVIVQVYEATTDALVFVDVVRTSTTVVTLNFAVAPANAKVYRVIVVA